ncbi:MAG: hypothetical protein IKA85_05215 [Clostridia bacterium]|nr:hypothetical protein [Clostridia bacterium]
MNGRITAVTILNKEKKSDFLADLSKARKEHAQSVNHSSTNSILNTEEKVNKLYVAIALESIKKDEFSRQEVAKGVAQQYRPSSTIIIY